MVDPVSGYPFEGWNQDPKRGLFLRSFTQLTAIGQWMELLANIVAGEAETPVLSREQALAQLAHLVKSLRQDQHDPRLSARGLLGNFLDLATGKRLGPLASDVDKQKLLDAFGPEKGEALWKALQAKGWIASRNQDREAADPARRATTATSTSTAPSPRSPTRPTRQKLLAILDQRVVMVVFGDNANLSASVAKTIGALLLPALKDEPELAAIRGELEHSSTTSARATRASTTRRPACSTSAGMPPGTACSAGRTCKGTGRPATWTTSSTSSAPRRRSSSCGTGSPSTRSRTSASRSSPTGCATARSLSPWPPGRARRSRPWAWASGSARLKRPSWRTLLENVVDIEVDYADRHQLPGFLSESYTGAGTQYTGSVGIPEITVDPKPRITDAASLYTLGAAYTVAPAKIEQFLAAHWPVVSTLLTDHGPWEGYNVSKREPIAFQTTAHTLALILGILGTGSDHMLRYLDANGLGGRTRRGLPDRRAGRPPRRRDPGLRLVRQGEHPPVLKRQGQGPFHVQSDRVEFVGIADRLRPRRRV